jgi:tripeptidyl-peptidase-1
MITSGGGFSLSGSQPLWQADIVNDYFTKVGRSAYTPFPGFNGQGRGFPDVSAVALNYEVIEAGQPARAAGTSASTPVFAGMVSLVNAARIQAGKSPLGWLNPMLYGLHKQFVKDILSGRNHCTASMCDLISCSVKTCCKEGFHAIEGWDPVTGLGSVNFTAFRDVALTLI